jgi:hypothetical protein
MVVILVIIRLAIRPIMTWIPIQKRICMVSLNYFLALLDLESIIIQNSDGLCGSHVLVAFWCTSSM